ncbi:MAG: DUF4301 family protein [Mucinivorans sp.]
MFSEKDIEQLMARGITPSKVKNQIEYFVNGFPFLPITAAARVGDGIVPLGADRAKELAAQWDQATATGRFSIVKFVPASGAATRMFKEYFEFIAGGDPSAAVQNSIDNIAKFAFFSSLRSMCADMHDDRELVKTMLSADGLGYGVAPKALIKFHKYTDRTRTALEEHLVEGALYGASSMGAVQLHFTVSPEHLDGFRDVVEKGIEFFERKFATTFEITYSVQKPSTDTIAVDMDNQPFRTESGELLFRPAGHGALIENLSELPRDVIFIKTVDNVQPDHRKADTVLYKKALAAYGLSLQSKIFETIRALEAGQIKAPQATAFVEATIGYKFGRQPSVEALIAVLNRPLRVCGMVCNEGEPGGGPFWAKEGPWGDESLQIAESSQIAPQQSELMKKSTHFNPVDIVCFTKNYRGERFDLTAYTDPATGFISKKSFAGRDLRAQELPGLWNGAMAHWNSVFVEVPISTFAPVKVLGDLLRPEHQ